mgnify:CR=1 FL=1
MTKDRYDTVIIKRKNPAKLFINNPKVRKHYGTQ